ncbi:MAG: prepilin-type N-terminal cleavage/methylation domain-containing protein [Bdellovibrionota bacterium]
MNVKVIVHKGFTLIEVMTVLLIISILASLAFPEFQRYARKAKNTEAINALGAMSKIQVVTFNERGHFAYCETDITDSKEQWATGQKFPLKTACTDNIEFPIANGNYTHFSYNVIPGKYISTGTLDPAIDAAATGVTPPVNFETTTDMFDVLGSGGASCNGFGAGVSAMTGVGLGLEATPPAGYGYYVAYAIANLVGTGVSFMSLAGEACSLIFQTVEYDPSTSEGFSISPIIIYSFGE